jgi:hypothetical protein
MLKLVFKPVLDYIWVVLLVYADGTEQVQETGFWFQQIKETTVDKW